MPVRRVSSQRATPLSPATEATDGAEAVTRPVCAVQVEAAVVQALVQRIGAARYGLWFRGQARFLRQAEGILVATRNQQVRDWLEHTFGLVVREAAKQACGGPVPVRWSVDPAAVQEEEATPAPTRQGTPLAPAAAIPTHRGPDPSLQLLDPPPSADHRASQPPKRTLSVRKKDNTPGTNVAGPTEELTASVYVSDTDKASRRKKGNSSPAGRSITEEFTSATLAPELGCSQRTEQSSITDLFGEPLPGASNNKRMVCREELAHRDTPLRGPRRWKRLEDFVVGACNRVAHAAAVSVVEEPEEVVTPLVFHGPTGVGKTHLLEGIYAGLKRLPEQRPCYVTAEEFTSRFVAAAHQGRLAAFRRQYREVTALLFDDLHFLATRKATQVEFLHTLDTLVAEGRPVVVTLDCHPRLADELMPELTDRLLGGAVWGLLPPDAETRLAILRHKAASAIPPIPATVLRTLAQCLRGNVRELEGAIHTLRHYARVHGRAVDLSLAREALGELIRHAIRVVTVAEVDAAVCTVLRLAPGTLQSKSRAWAVTHPRMLAVYLCRKHTAATYGEIARHFGAKTHSTAVAAEKKVRQWLEQSACLTIGSQVWNVRDLIERIERQLQR